MLPLPVKTIRSRPTKLFFRNLLRRNPHQHPLLYLKGVKYKDLLGILDFMYNGEVNVAQEELKQFLAVAGDLKVKGLTQKMAVPTFSTMVRPTIPELSTSPMNKREPNIKEPANKRHCPTLAPRPPQISTPENALQQAGKDEILEVVPVQPVVKHSPKSKIVPTQKATYATPKKIRANTTPAPKILEQCILEAEIEPVPKKTIQVVLEKTNSMVTVTSSKGKLPFLSHLS
jgi:hypothetical protein